MSRSTFVRQPLPQVRRRYDRMARWYRAAEITLLLPHRLRHKAVQRLDLEPGETVLEIGCGTGRNLPLLCETVGEDGQVIGVDASAVTPMNRVSSGRAPNPSCHRGLGYA
jgi:ubiquinone/menaquinone biosynthesis C-methylase UbiE